MQVRRGKKEKKRGVPALPEDLLIDAAQRLGTRRRAVTRARMSYAMRLRLAFIHACRLFLCVPRTPHMLRASIVYWEGDLWVPAQVYCTSTLWPALDIMVVKILGEPRDRHRHPELGCHGRLCRFLALPQQGLDVSRDVAAGWRKRGRARLVRKRAVSVVGVEGIPAYFAVDTDELSCCDTSLPGSG
jgi:hypothetical protein